MVERSEEIEHFVLSLYESISAGDAEAATELIASEEGVLFVGTDQGEWRDSTEAARGALRSELEAAGRLQITVGHPKAFRDGDFGWFSDRPALVLPDGSKASLRLTGVVGRSEGAWKLVQGHLSVAANLNARLFP